MKRIRSDRPLSGGRRFRIRSTDRLELKRRPGCKEGRVFNFHLVLSLYGRNPIIEMLLLDLLEDLHTHIVERLGVELVHPNQVEAVRLPDRFTYLTCLEREDGIFHGVGIITATFDNPEI